MSIDTELQGILSEKLWTKCYKMAENSAKSVMYKVGTPASGLKFWAKKSK